MLAALLGLVLAAQADAEPVPFQRLETLDAVKQQLRAPGAHAQVVHFWALWCGPCVEELPRQVALARRATERGAQVAFVNLDGPEKADAARAALERLGAFEVARQYQLNLALDPAAVAALFDRRWEAGLPATFAFDARGRRLLSILEPTRPPLEKRLLTALLASTPTR